MMLEIIRLWFIKSRLIAVVVLITITSTVGNAAGDQGADRTQQQREL